MLFLTGVFAIDAPASALNNGKGEDITGRVKAIRAGRYEYPYVSAQALRYWLRQSVAAIEPAWQPSPIYRSKGRQQAYTVGDPIRYWDDDLFGYMRAEKEEALTRVAPFRTSTVVASAPVDVTEDFGVMARGGGDPILHGHEFYRAALVGSFSINLGAVGVFATQDRAGYRNLGAEAAASAASMGLMPIREGGQVVAWALPAEVRAARVAALLRAFARLEGGAKQALHYTDVAPAFACMAVLRGGNHPFMNVIAPTVPPSLHTAALDEALSVYRDDFRSPLWVGLRQGFMDGAFGPLAERGIQVVHPRHAFDEAAAAVLDNPDWLS